MRIVFMGTPAAAAVSLRRCVSDGHEVAAVYTQPDRPAGRRKHLAASAVKQSALELGLEVIQPEKIRTPEAHERFKSFDAEAAVVVAYGRILPESFLTAFPHGAINVHFSLLPKYRGAAPVNWAIVNGESQTGVTTMQMDVGLDTGDVLLQKAVDIGPDETSIELMERLAHVGADLLSETLGRLDEITPVKQDEAQATLAPIMRKDDGRIEWTRRAVDIINRVRGFQPFPTSYTYFDSTKLTIWRARAGKSEDLRLIPGTVLCTAGGHFEVACGFGTSIVIDEIQPEGKRRMSSRDFVNGFKIPVGAVLS